MTVRRFLFVCGKNRWRSPTAEQIFSGRTDLEVLSAGVAAESETPIDAELVQWADCIFVMENRHRQVIRSRFADYLGQTRIVCLGIPDRYRFMDGELVNILERRMARHIGG
ncbi:MAG: protein tyrosine phosphatase [Sphingomonadaceae bacterium]|nr:phosphotyrosine protein phosphatase [Sphingomonadaceae bacterium]MCP5391827.1 protein tyrosine phosphatase [Sphingomonadaceae bacterium]